MWPGKAKKNREGLERELDRIRQRLDRCESAPRSDPDLTISTDVQYLRDRQQEQSDVIARMAPDVSQLTRDVAELQEEAKDLLLAVADGIERTDRAERRVHATVKRARKALADRGVVDGGLEAEHDELEELPDPSQPTLPLAAKVVAAPAVSSVRGVTAEQLKRVTGF